MAELKVFISSTCYDLSILRSDLRSFITDLGYKPIMSEYSDVTYNPTQHTHVSCIKEVENCDIFILVIGSRYGGKGIPDAIDSIDFNKLDELIDVEKNDSKQFSITQLEVLKAIELDIPIYTFIDKKIYYFHEIYEKNKHKPDIIDNIFFPGIEKKDTAKYIFEFVNIMRKRTVDNFFFPFENTNEIKNILKKQWAGYFKILLQEKRYKTIESKKIDSISEQFENLKAAILSSIENADKQETARGVVKYRRLADFLFGIKLELSYLRNTNDSFEDLLNKAKIVEIINATDIISTRPYYSFARSFLIKEDCTFYECRWVKDVFSTLAEEWTSFKNIKQSSKGIILETLHEITKPGMLLRYRNSHIEDFVKQFSEKDDNVS